MGKYFIKEYNSDMTLIELRICAFLCCEERINKITQILNYLNRNNFLVSLTLMYNDRIRAENIEETNDLPSLTIDTRNNKFRFKYWNGAEILWLFHTEDLFEALIQQRDNYQMLSNKYAPVTEIVFDAQKQYSNSIRKVSYQYYPDNNIEIVYHLVFSKVVEEKHFENKFIKEIYDKIQVLDDKFLEDLNFSIEFDFQEVDGCHSCEQAKIERETNDLERKN